MEPESLLELYARYTKANEEADAANKEIERRVLSQLKELLENNNLEQAKSLVSGMPDCVSKVFALDMLRQYTKKL